MRGKIPIKKPVAATCIRYMRGGRADAASENRLMWEYWGGQEAKANAMGTGEKLLWKQYEDNGKVNFLLAMAATGHLAEKEEFKHTLFHCCIAKQHAQTSTVLAQNGNNEENACAVGEKVVGDTDLINAQRACHRRLPDFLLCSYTCWNRVWAEIQTRGSWILCAWLCTQVQVSTAAVTATSLTSRTASVRLSPSQKRFPLWLMEHRGAQREQDTPKVLAEGLTHCNYHFPLGYRLYF